MEFKEFIDFSEKTVALKPMKYFTQFKFNLKIKEITGNVQMIRCSTKGVKITNINGAHYMYQMRPL